MAGGSLLALLDDIATLLDDISVLTKVAAKKTAGVLGDDLALNAEQVSGIRAERELPVVWAVAKGSFVNKLILVPVALAISAFIPWLITPLLMLGGLFLCYEGFEKVLHKFFPDGEKEKKAGRVEILNAVADPAVDLVAFEKAKVRGAIRTDFILSAEIIVIALGTVKEAQFAVQVVVVSLIAVLITAVVYGLVAGVVKLDDAGLHLLQEQAAGAWSEFKRALGRFLLRLAPWLMKGLTVVGTAAMFLVGGGILVHGIPWLYHWVESLAVARQRYGTVLEMGVPVMLGGLAGVIAGGVVFTLVSFGERIGHRLRGKESEMEKADRKEQWPV